MTGARLCFCMNSLSFPNTEEPIMATASALLPNGVLRFEQEFRRWSGQTAASRRWIETDPVCSKL